MSRQSITKSWNERLTFEWLNEIIWCYHSNETSSPVLSHCTIHLVCSSNVNVWVHKSSSALLSHGTIHLKYTANFWVCGWNSMVWPFTRIWNLFSRYFHLVLFKLIFNCLLWCEESHEISSVGISLGTIYFVSCLSTYLPR